MQRSLRRGVFFSGMPLDDPFRWYTRPVLFVASCAAARAFYVEQLDFTVAWASPDDWVCQVNHGECEIILCTDAARAGQGRVFIELTNEAHAALDAWCIARDIPMRELFWGHRTLQLTDPDGNELYFPYDD